SCDRPERRVAPEDHHDEPEDDRSYDCLPANGNEDAEAGRDAFAAAKLQPDGKSVANHGKYCAQHHPANIPAGPMAGDPDSELAFSYIEPQRECTRDGADIPRDVRGADVPAADAANVGPPKCFHDEQAKWNRAQDVGDDGDQSGDIHKGCVESSDWSG